MFLLMGTMVQLLPAQSGITNQGPFTVFRTGGSTNLISRAVGLFLPNSSAVLQIQFLLGFSTEEPDAGSTFFDSFSVTLQDSAHTALLVTADRFGPLWAPNNPGGVTLSTNSIVHPSIPFPASITPNYAVKFAFLVTFSVPSDFLGETNSLFFDFFDNQNSTNSVGFYSTPRVILPLWLQSSASPQGPYADETGVQIDIPSQTITIPKFSPARFFRMRSTLPIRMNRPLVQGEDLAFQFHFEPITLVLEAASSAAGPFNDETNVVFDLVTQKATIPTTLDRFYRIRSEVPVEVTSKVIQSNRTVLDFIFRPPFLALESSASVSGPFSSEQNIQIQPGQTSFRIPKTGPTRSFRLRSITPLTITRLQSEGSQWRFFYQ